MPSRRVIGDRHHLTVDDDTLFNRSRAPAPAGRVPPFLLLRRVEGDILVSPFPKRARGPSPEQMAAVKVVAAALTPALPAGAHWVSVQDGRATPAAIAVPQVQRRMLDCFSFNVPQPWRSAAA